MPLLPILNFGSIILILDFLLFKKRAYFYTYLPKFDVEEGTLVL
jgi:hypothetical protein